MEEKRLSIRFRMDNEQDKQAWDLLQRISDGENTSKNAVALRLICKGAENTEIKENVSLDVMSERIADLVANKLAGKCRIIEKFPKDKEVPESRILREPHTDDLRPISDEALSFLDEF